MSLILKGIDMPTDCGHCKFFGKSWVEKDNSWCDLTENHITYVGEIADFCPLVEIPTPHGRLIDKDELLSHLKKDPLFDLVERYGVSGVIESRPTILEAEE